MAHTSARSFSLAAPLAVLADIFSGIWDALIRIGDANSKVQQIKALSAMTDAELAERGLKREDIIRRVMSDVI